MKKPSSGHRLGFRPKTRCTLRALGGRRVVVEGFGQGAPAFVTIAGSSDVPVSAWLSPRELRRLVKTAERILK